MPNPDDLQGLAQTGPAPQPNDQPQYANVHALPARVPIIPFTTQGVFGPQYAAPPNYMPGRDEILENPLGDDGGTSAVAGEEPTAVPIEKGLSQASVGACLLYTSRCV